MLYASFYGVSRLHRGLRGVFTKLALLSLEFFLHTDIQWRNCLHKYIYPTIEWSYNLEARLSLHRILIPRPHFKSNIQPPFESFQASIRTLCFSTTAFKSFNASKFPFSMAPSPKLATPPVTKVQCPIFSFADKASALDRRIMSRD